MNEWMNDLLMHECRSLILVSRAIVEGSMYKSRRKLNRKFEKSDSNLVKNYSLSGFIFA